MFHSILVAQPTIAGKFWTEYLLPYGAGYSVALFAGWLVIWLSRKLIWGALGYFSTDKETPHDKSWMSAIYGLIERVIYVSTILTYPVFVLGWLALKTGKKWTKEWSTFMKKRIKKDIGLEIEGWVAYEVYVMLNGLSVIFGIAGAYVIRLIHNKEWMGLWCLLGIIIVLIIILVFVLLIFKIAYNIAKKAKQSKTTRK